MGKIFFVFLCHGINTKSLRYIKKYEDFSFFVTWTFKVRTKIKNPVRKDLLKFNKKLFLIHNLNTCKKIEFYLKNRHV
jgi:hypothetical protein